MVAHPFVFFFFQAEDGIRDLQGDWSSDVCSSDLSAAVDFTKQDLPELTRSLVRVGFVRRTDAGFFSSIEGTLVPLKPSSDLEAGAGWRRPGRGSEEGRVGEEGRSRWSPDH